jgi:PTS system galactitol-specific IIC component
MIGAIVMVVVATQGNVVRAFIIGIPIVIGKLYVASVMAGLYTALAHKVNFEFEGYNGVITSFLDGGNLFRFWIVKTLQGNLLALIFIPVAILLLIITKRAQMVSFQSYLDKPKSVED